MAYFVYLHYPQVMSIGYTSPEVQYNLKGHNIGVTCILQLKLEVIKPGMDSDWT